MDVRGIFIGSVDVRVVLDKIRVVRGAVSRSCVGSAAHVESDLAQSVCDLLSDVVRQPEERLCAVSFAHVVVICCVAWCSRCVGIRLESSSVDLRCKAVLWSLAAVPYGA